MDTAALNVLAQVQAKPYPIGALLSRDLRSGTLTLWIGYMAVMFTIYLTNTWLPYLFREAGFATVRSQY